MEIFIISLSNILIEGLALSTGAQLLFIKIGDKK